MYDSGYYYNIDRGEPERALQNRDYEKNARTA